MRRATICTVIWAILACFYASSANAESKNKTSKSKKAQSKSFNKFDETAFDLTRTTLPLKYRGHDAMKLHTALNKRIKMPKTEFETTEQFNNKKADGLIKPILGKLTVNDIYAFMIKPISDNEVFFDTERLINDEKINYSADKQLITFRLSDSPIANFSEKTRTYKGTNGYGAIVEVSSYNSKIWKIKLKQSNLHQFVSINDIDKYSRSIDIGLENITPIIAKEYKNNLRVLVIAKSEDPYTSETSRNTDATYDSPIETVTETYKIHCSAIEIWIYNFKTGAVLKKFKIPSTEVVPIIETDV
jgi:hypothetical protein